jgi:tetratricopeptide (TPR) repeat protein/predicted Ser/Thr protein kinase
MSSERHERLHAVFRAVCDLTNAARDRHLDELCAGDDALREDVRRLLAQDRTESDFLAIGPLSVSGLETPHRNPAPPEQIGRYRVLRTLGEGGMGVVYLAEQENPRRQVALKLLRPGTTSRARLERFRLEAQVLARLQHPGIAQVYEAGAADWAGDPQPFFAMEYVEGRPLIEYAAGRRLDVRARLRLIAQIALAVHHAHQKGVIHRDLKPANILVTEAGLAKVLDFGVARATDADVQTATLHTSAGELLGTLPYMSPEQAGGDPNEIDTRTDVYALGVLAYELLTGRLPHDVRRRTLPEALRMIRDDPPVRLSSVQPRLRGDVEHIVGKALQKDRRLRYPSAAALAEDIERHLRSDPIMARPPSVVYQVRKFARRHVGLVTSLGLIFALLVGVVVVTSRQAAQLAQQRDEAREAQHALERTGREKDAALADARKAARVSDATSGFLADLLRLASPNVGRHDITVVEALDIAARRVDEKLAGEPEVAAAVRQRLSATYHALGRLESSVEQARLSLTDLESAPDAAPMMRVQAYAAMALALHDQGKIDEAVAVTGKAVALARETLPPEEPQRLTLMTTHGALLYALQRFEEAEAIMRETLELQERVFGPGHPSTLAALNNLANVTEQLGRAEEGERLLRRCMDLHRENVGDRHPNTIATIYNYGSILRERGRLDEAEALLRECVALGRQHLPTRHWLAGSHRGGYGDLLRELGRYEEAESLLLDSFHILSGELGDGHERTRRAAQRLVTLYEAWQKPEATAEWRERLQAPVPQP